MDSWVGGIKLANFKLWLTTPDGSRCALNETDPCILGQFEERRDNVRIKSRIIVWSKIQYKFFRTMIFLILLNFILVKVCGDQFNV